MIWCNEIWPFGFFLLLHLPFPRTKAFNSNRNSFVFKFLCPSNHLRGEVSVLQTVLRIVLHFLLWCYSEQSSEMWPVNTWTVGPGFSSYYKKKSADYAEYWVLIWNTIRYQETVFRYKHPVLFFFNNYFIEIWELLAIKNSNYYGFRYWCNYKLP